MPHSGVIIHAMERSKRGLVATVVIAICAMVGVTAAFMSSASPYVTVAEAKTAKGESLHLAGQIDAKTLTDDRIHGKLSFVLIDKNGDRIQVVHTGEPVNNLGDVKQVVAIGHVEKGVFVSEKMLVKCPTKYESDESKSGA